METEQISSPVTFAGRYQIVGLLGRGGMGDVFLAKDTLIGNSLVALKVLFHDSTKDHIIADRFIREIQATRMISHPNVVRTFDFGNYGKRMFFTMEYVQGITLENELEKVELSTEEALGLFYQLSLGLIAIHESEVIHRDIKPSNIIIGKDGIAKYNDFGVAHLKDSSLTQSYDLLGTTLYMAPELFKSARSTPAIDIYSLGVIAYKMFTDATPFKGENDFQLQHVKRASEVIPPTSYRSGLSSSISDLILNMLAVEPENRITSSELCRKIEDISINEYKIDKNQLQKPYSVKSQVEIKTEDLNIELILNRPHLPKESDTLSKSLKDALSIIAKNTVLSKISPQAKIRLYYGRIFILFSITLVLAWYVAFSNSFREKLFSPGGVTGLVAWFNCDSLNLKEGDKVGSLVDSSLNRIIATQNELERQPTFRARRAYGYPVLEFDGENDFLEANQIAVKLRDSTDATLIYVANAYEKKAQHYVLTAHLEDKTTNLFHVGFFEDNRIRIRTIKNPYPAGYHDSDPVITSALSVYTVTFEKRNVSVFQNGKKLFVDQINDSIEYARATYFSIGQEYDQKEPADFFRGQLAEIFVYNRALDNSERKKVEKLLAEKYLLSIRAD